MKISDVLAVKGRNVITVLDTDTVSAVVQLLSSRRIGAVVVQDRWMKLSGIFTERDLMNALAGRGPDVLPMQVGAVMTSSVITCRLGDQVEDTMRSMTMNRIRHLPVVEDGQLLGMISIGDLVHHRLGEKEMEANVLLDINRMHG